MIPYGIITVLACSSTTELSCCETWASKNRGTGKPARGALCISVLACLDLGSRGMSPRAWEPSPAQPEQESTLERVGDVNHAILNPCPHSWPRQGGSPRCGANPGTSIPCGTHHHRALPRNEPLLWPHHIFPDHRAHSSLGPPPQLEAQQSDL